MLTINSNYTHYRRMISSILNPNLLGGCSISCSSATVNIGSSSVIGDVVTAIGLGDLLLIGLELETLCGDAEDESIRFRGADGISDEVGTGMSWAC